jgi:hypothetical protein
MNSLLHSNIPFFLKKKKIKVFRLKNSLPSLFFSFPTISHAQRAKSSPSLSFLIPLPSPTAGHRRSRNRRLPLTTSHPHLRRIATHRQNPQISKSPTHCQNPSSLSPTDGRRAPVTASHRHAQVFPLSFFLTQFTYGDL